ncbi:hypothetical protein DaAHT2_2380 [Desulfurivibrio alkaliphilus AHT 2]|uniref:Type II secretion system protein n=1 Tax=Desulfurivibrio alkaliphilus (strain DSM 19089 / UNIQEM U267 / AHT2) TaxID=589865 RepID=D6Z758_DESAT|nr:hypothetical protein DaAHT2_2380 [Desulfurivibrio alkaliphilus AHT 2]
MLVLAAMLAAIAGAGLTSIARGYLMARESTAMAQKAQLALTRLSNELKVCYDCFGDNDLSLPASFNNTQGHREVAFNDKGEITLNDGIPLIDRVSSFSLAYDDDNGNPDLVIITFELEHQQTGGTLKFSTSVLPRNSYR